MSENVLKKQQRQVVSMKMIVLDARSDRRFDAETIVLRTQADSICGAIENTGGAKMI